MCCNMKLDFTRVSRNCGIEKDGGVWTFKTVVILLWNVIYVREVVCKYFTNFFLSKNPHWQVKGDGGAMWQCRSNRAKILWPEIASRLVSLVRTAHCELWEGGGPHFQMLPPPQTDPVLLQHSEAEAQISDVLITWSNQTKAKCMRRYNQRKVRTSVSRL